MISLILRCGKIIILHFWGEGGANVKLIYFEEGNCLVDPNLLEKRQKESVKMM